MRNEPLQLEPQSDTSSEYSPDEQLLVDIIRQTIKDYQGDTQPFKNHAESWLFSDSEEPFSFNWCCDMLGVAPEVILQRI